MSEFTSCDDCANKTAVDACLYCSHRYTDNFRPKPKQKIIDLSMVGSDVDMEFTNLEDFKIQPYHTAVGKLTGFDNSTDNNYTIKNDVNKYTKCRIRQDHWHSFKGDKCPLPEGLIISYSSMAGTRRSVNRCTNYSNLVWSLVYEFKVYGTADTHRYEYQKEKE